MESEGPNPHAGVLRLVHDLHQLYRKELSLHELDCEQAGFQWIDCNDADQSIVSLMRKSKAGEFTVVVLKFTPVVRTDYRVGVPLPGTYHERLNSDAEVYGGSGAGNMGTLTAVDHASHGHHHSLLLRVPPLAARSVTSGCCSTPG